MQRLLLIAICLLPVCAYSQHWLEGFSLKSGVSISTQAYKPVAFLPTIKGSNNIVSGFYHVQYSIRLFPKVEVNVGFQLMEKGYRYKAVDVGAGYSTTVYSTEYQYRLNYMEMPVNLVFKVKKIGFIAGWIPSYLYEANYRYVDITSTIPPGKTQRIYASNYNGPYPNRRFWLWDMGVNLGVSYRFSKHMDIELSAQKHFIRPDTRPHVSTYNDIMYNQCYVLGVRYHFLAK